MAAYWAFAVYAAVVILVARGDDAIWAAWAVPAYGVAAVMVSNRRRARGASRCWPRSRSARRLLMLAQGDLAAGMAVIERSATLLVRDGTPYLPAHQPVVLAADPYLPAVALFGLPSASDPARPAIRRVWLVLVTSAALAAALRVLLPHPALRGLQARPAAGHGVRGRLPGAGAEPGGDHDPDRPVLALMLLALSLISYPERVVPAAATLGLACAMKPTAARSRCSRRCCAAGTAPAPAVVFTGTAFAFVVAAATLPAVIASPVRDGAEHGAVPAGSGPPSHPRGLLDAR